MLNKDNSLALNLVASHTFEKEYHFSKERSYMFLFLHLFCKSEISFRWKVLKEITDMKMHVNMELKEKWIRGWGETSNGI